jgi:WD40 repeat protein
MVEQEKFKPQDEHNGDVREVVLSDDGLQVLSCSGDRKTKLWDIDSGSCVVTFDCEAQVNSCRFVSRFGTRNRHDETWAGSGLVLTCSKAGARLWDIDTAEKIMDPFCDAHDGKVSANCCTVLENDSRIALCQRGGSTTLVDLRTAPGVMRLDAPDA